MQYQAYSIIYLFVLAAANLITGLITMLIMSNKGRSGLLGFAIGFVLPVIGILIAMIIPEDPLHLHRRMMKYMPRNNAPAVVQPMCPSCRSALTPGAVFCARCGTRVR